MLLVATSLGLSARSALAQLPPVAIAEATPSEALADEAVTFDASRSSDPDGSQTLVFSWDFGDGGTASTASLTHRFSVPGLYVVTLVVSDGSASSSTRIEVVVLARPQPSLAVSSAPLALGFHDRELWTVNPDSDSVSLVELRVDDRVTEVSVGRDPRSLTFNHDETRLYVACRGSRELTIIDTTRRVVVGSIPTLGAPFGLARVPGTTLLLVSHDDTGRVAVFDDDSLIERASFDIGEPARAIAVAGDGTRAYLAHYLTRGDVGRVSVVDLETYSIADVIEFAEDHSRDTESSGSGFPNLLGSIAIQPGGARLWVGGLKANTARGLYLSGQPLTFANRLRGVLLPVDLATSTERTDLRIDTNDADQVSGIAFSPRGRHALLTHQGAGSVSTYDLGRQVPLDASDGSSVNVLARISSGTAPQGIVVSTEGTRAYVLDYLSRSISVLDTTDFAQPRVLSHITVTAEALAPDIALGKRMFYRSDEPLHSKQSYIACASCHPEGGHDGRTWDFTQFGEGLRNTIDLRGKAGLGNGPLHWSANFDEVQDFENDIVDGFLGTGLAQDGDAPHPPLGSLRNAGRSPELDALAAYVSSLGQTPHSPARTADGGLDASATRGRALFFDPRVDCAACHPAPRFTDSLDATDPLAALHDVGTLSPASGHRLGGELPGIDTPSLLGAWLSAPYLHDGSAATLEEVLTARNPDDLHGATSQLGASEVSDLAHFVASLDGSPDEVAPRMPAAHDDDARGCQSSGAASLGALALLLTLSLRRPKPSRESQT